MSDDLTRLYFKLQTQRQKVLNTQHEICNELMKLHINNLQEDISILTPSFMSNNIILHKSENIFYFECVFICKETSEKIKFEYCDGEYIAFYTNVDGDCIVSSDNINKFCNSLVDFIVFT